MFQVLENTIVDNSTVERNATLTETTLENFAKQAVHCYNFDDVDTLGARNRKLDILAINISKPVAFSQVFIYVCTCYAWDQVQGVNGRKYKKVRWTQEVRTFVRR